MELVCVLCAGTARVHIFLAPVLCIGRTMSCLLSVIARAVFKKLKLSNRLAPRVDHFQNIRCPSGMLGSAVWAELDLFSTLPECQVSGTIGSHVASSGGLYR